MKQSSGFLRIYSLVMIVVIAVCDYAIVCRLGLTGERVSTGCRT